MIKAIYKAPNEKAKVIEIEDTLEAYQKAVTGTIETLLIAENTIIICNEDGKNHEDISANFVLGLQSGWTDVIVGPVLIVGTCEDDFISLTEEQQKKYLKLFNKAKRELGMTIPFIKIGG